MDKFKNRLKFFGVGFSFGIIAVIFFFGERGCSWLPQNRIKNLIAEKEIQISDSLFEVLYCLDGNEEEIYDLLNRSGSVHFSESETKSEPKIYLFSNSKDLKVRFSIYEYYSEIISISREEKSCNTTINSSSQIKKALPLPDKIVNSIIESNELSFYPQAECQLNCYQITKKEIAEFHKTAKINMSLSKPWISVNYQNLKENKTYFLEGDFKGMKLGVLYEIGENRTRIKLVLNKDGDCDC